MATPPAGSSLTPPLETTHPIVFFDGVCGLCNGFVDWLMKRDKSGKLRFAPLQGPTARAHVGDLAADADGWSVVLVDEDGTHERSEAVLRSLAHIGGVWRVSSGLRIVPRGLRDFVYRAIAKRRYRWFEKRAACRIPTDADRGRILE